MVHVMVEKKINHFLSDRSSGAEELAKRECTIILEMLTEGRPREEIYNFIKASSKQFPEMNPLQKIKHFFADIEINRHNLRKIKTQVLDSDYVRQSKFLFTKQVKLLTFSNSSSVFNVVNRYKNMIKKVYCSHSLPLGEGKVLIKKLREAKINSTLIEDGEGAEYLRKIDFILIGADAIYQNFFINKIGTYQLTKLAKQFRKPVYVIAAKSKFADNNSFDANKIGKYFEKIDRKLVTKIIS